MADGATSTKTDLRVVKSRQAIKAAALRLLSRPGSCDVTPKDIADEALVNKKTFFAHYASVSAVFDELEEDALAEVRALLPGHGLGFKSVKDARTACERIAALARDRASSLGSVLSTRLRPELIDRMRSALAARLEEGLAGAGAAAGRAAGAVASKAAYACDFVAGGAMSLFERWLQDDDSDPSAFTDLVLGYLDSARSLLGLSGVQSGGNDAD